MTSNELDKVDCIQFYNIISEYYDEQLSEHDKELFEKHFTDCKLCMRFFNSFLDTMSLISGPVKKKYESIEMPDEIKEKMISFLLERKGK